MSNIDVPNSGKQPSSEAAAFDTSTSVNSQVLRSAPVFRLSR